MSSTGNMAWRINSRQAVILVDARHGVMDQTRRQALSSAARYQAHYRRHQQDGFGGLRPGHLRDNP